MDDTERYLFDLNGYLALPGVLSAETLLALNALMDERIARDVAADATTHRFADVLDWGPAVRALIDHERILPYLEEILGNGFRLDHDYADLIRSGKGPIGTRLHGGAVPFDPGAVVHLHRGPAAVGAARRRLQPARRQRGRRRVRLRAW